jgi:uncharacterized membrane protein
VNSERAFEWQLASWLGWPQEYCWLLLALIALGGVILMGWFYRHTLRALTWRQRLIFVALRSGFFLSLLLCLAGPARVERVFDTGQTDRPLAVLVDRSPSMTVPDSRGTTRLSAAVRVWKTIEPDAIRTFPHIRYFRFAASADSATDLEQAVTVPESATDTHLYDSLNQVMREAPPGGYGGIVCLTDGLDTTNATSEECVSRSLQNHSPLYFCVGQGHSLPQESLLVREFDVPGEVLRRSRFNARIVVQAHTDHARDISISLWQDNRSIASASLHLQAGANLIPWTVPIDSAEAGLMHLECRLADGTEEEAIAATVPVVAQEQIHILFYQGSVDWSYRFINLAIQTDPTFSVIGLFNPELNLTREITSSPQDPALTQLPDQAAQLQRFHIVVLSNVVADQISPAQQTALTNYVRAGGGVLFLVSDTKMAQTFSGTALEQMMPVVFEAPAATENGSSAEEEFQAKMRLTAGGTDPGQEGEFAAEAQADPGPTPLKFFALASSPKRSDVAALFGSASAPTAPNLPQFITYAQVHGLKAGGEVLAVHPEDKTDGGDPRALLVSQRFGQGHVTALLTDGLWRWKLSLPSDSHDSEIFWQQLFRALARQETRHDNLRFGLQPLFASLNQGADFRLDGAQGPNAPLITAISPSGKPQDISPQFNPQNDSWSFQVKPGESGKWRIRATDGRGAEMETLLRISNNSHGAELSGLPPDTDGLRTLAASTGGSLLDDGTPDDWSSERGPNSATLVSRRSEPLWDNWLILLVGLGFYLTELLWRRRAKLL